MNLIKWYYNPTIFDYIDLFLITLIPMEESPRVVRPRLVSIGYSDLIETINNFSDFIVWILYLPLLFRKVGDFTTIMSGFRSCTHRFSNLPLP